MTNKLKLWDHHASWESAEAAWDQGAIAAATSQPIKKLNSLPNMPGITTETRRFLKWKSLYWMVSQDKKGEIRRGFFRHPLRYGWAFLRSLLKSKSYRREEDFFLYGLNSLTEFETLVLAPKTLLVLGFSYCHKPFECPSGRFTDQCQHDSENPVCRQCFIGKAVHASPTKNIIPLFIPTVHYIGGQVFDIVHQYPDQKVIFLITACEMTLEMFGDFGNMVGIQGIGVRLDGRICNTMKAFELSEKGIKPGLTVVREPTQRQILEILKLMRTSS